MSAEALVRQADALVARARAAGDLHGGLRHLDVLRQKRDQFGVGLAVHRRGLEQRAPRAVLELLEAAFARVGLDGEGEEHRDRAIITGYKAYLYCALARRLAPDTLVCIRESPEPPTISPPVPPASPRASSRSRPACRAGARGNPRSSPPRWA